MNHLRRTVLTTSCAAALLLAPAFISSASVASVAPIISHGVRIPVTLPGGFAANAALQNTWAAENWSGYAETGTFTGVSGTWTVPAVSATSSSTYSSAWIGVDGFNDNDLIQTGTEQDYYSGAAHYDAWWEILPAAETEISTSIVPGRSQRPDERNDLRDDNHVGGRGRFRSPPHFFRARVGHHDL